MTRLCAARGCPRPAHPDRTLCVHCTWLLGRDLGDVPTLVRELDTTRARQTTHTTTGSGARSAVIPLPYDPRAGDAATALHATLTHWAAALHHPAHDPPPARTGPLARWLTRHTTTLLRHDNAHLAAAQIRDTVAAAWRAIDRPAERQYAGACTCGVHLYAHPGRPHVTCRGCGTTHDADLARTRMQDHLDGTLMTGAEIAHLAAYFGHADRERVRNLLKVWGNRGVITPRGHTKNGHPLYPFGDTLRLVTTRAYTHAG